MNGLPFANPPSLASGGDDPHDASHHAAVVPASDADEYEPDVVEARRPVSKAARERQHHLLLGEE